MAGMLPDGVVPLLFTDVDGSTRLWEDAPDAMMEALGAHDSIVGQVLQTRDGVSVRPRGEGEVLVKGLLDRGAATPRDTEG